MSNTTNKAWQGRTDGLPWMHRTLIWLMRFLPLGLLYLVVDIVCVFYMLFSHKSYLAIYHFYRRQFGFKPMKAFGAVYLNFREFAHIISDRFAAYAGKQFTLETENTQLIDDTSNGCIMLSSHVGNYEFAGYFLQPKKKAYTLLYGGEKGTILENRRKMFAAKGIEMILASDDLSHVFKINEALDNSEIITMFGDRLFGSPKALRVQILQSAAKLPKGPFVIASRENTTAFCVFVLKSGWKKYKVIVRELSGKTPQDFATDFANQLTDIVEQYPYQWFNYFEFFE